MKAIQRFNTKKQDTTVGVVKNSLARFTETVQVTGCISWAKPKVTARLSYVAVNSLTLLG